MSDSTTITVRLDKAVKKRLETAAARVRRSKSFLAAEAIEEYLAIQDWQVEAIKHGIAAADRGETVPHDKVKAWAASLGTRKELPRPKSK
jgi:RHH-type transcriptional regulator, rel operon repressor / antitoxin RelB